MNWPLFAIACWLCAVLQVGLAPLLSVGGRLPGGGAQFLLVLAAFAAVCVPRAPQAVLAACVAGLVMDLQAETIPGAPLMGPLALGFAAGATAVCWFRKKGLAPSVLSIVLAVFIAGVVAHGVALVLLYARGVALPGLPGERVPGFAPSRELLGRFIAVVCSAALALPMGALLMLSLPLWGMSGKQVERRFGQAE